jgi:acetyltransferase
MPQTRIIRDVRHRQAAGVQPDGGWHTTLPDGTAIRIRPIRSQDADLELEFLNHLSPEYRGSRFLGLVRDPTPEVARDLTDLDPAKAAGFVAVVSGAGGDRQVGAAHFYTNVAGNGCDCSLAVSEDWQNRGIGSLLMRLLIDAARARGIRHMRAFAPVRSGGSEQLAERLGFQRCLDPHDPVTVLYDLNLG